MYDFKDKTVQKLNREPYSTLVKKHIRSLKSNIKAKQNRFNFKSMLLTVSFTVVGILLFSGLASGVVATAIAIEDYDCRLEMQSVAKDIYSTIQVLEKEGISVADSKLYMEKYSEIPDGMAFQVTGHESSIKSPETSLLVTVGSDEDGNGMIDENAKYRGSWKSSYDK